MGSPGTLRAPEVSGRMWARWEGGIENGMCRGMAAAELESPMRYCLSTANPPPKR